MSTLFQRPSLRLKSSISSLGSKSANSSPKGNKSFDINSRDTFSISSVNAVNKSAYGDLMKSLEDLGNNFEKITQRYKGYDKDLFDLIKSCERSFKITKQKFLEVSTEDDFGKLSESNGLQEVSSIFKPEANEYGKFLEYLLSYEQSKTELVIKKSKFPKIRMKEIEKALNDEYLLKSPSYSKIVKSSEPNLTEKCTMELKQFANKIKKNLLINSKVPEELTQELEKLCVESNEEMESIIANSNTMKSISLANENTRIIKEKEKTDQLFDLLSKDHKKLTAKYTYLINKLNKQDSTIKIQSKLISHMSTSSALLREQFLQFTEEISFYISLLVENLSCKGNSKCSIILTAFTPKEAVAPLSEITNKLVNKEKELSSLKAEKESLASENAQLKAKVIDLEANTKELSEKCNKLQIELEESDDSLDLTSNIKDIIEIQKLKDQIRLLNFKSNESVTYHQKELDSFKSQLSRVKSEKFNLEERIKSLNIKISELCSEREAFQEEIHKLKNQQIEYFRPSRFSLETVSVGEVSSRSEQCARVNPTDIIAIIQDEIDEIAACLRNTNIITDPSLSSIDVIKKSVELLKSLKECLNEDSGDFTITIKNLVSNQKPTWNFEAQENLFDYESRVLKTDPDTYLIEKQLEIYKCKLSDKKSQLSLHKQQIAYLKKRVRDIQSEVAKTSTHDIDCIKDMFTTIVKDIPALCSETEQMVIVLMKILGFTPGELTAITFERRSKKHTNFFKGIFH